VSEHAANHRLVTVLAATDQRTFNSRRASM
jgi:hypothetical protein